MDIHKSEFLIACYKKIPYVVNTINKYHIHSYLHYGYIHNFYHDKQEIVDEIFCQYIKPLLKYIGHPTLIQ